ncbi:MAG: hypothetical protein R6V46_18230 [Desulfatiglandaceae bacterium]
MKKIPFISIALATIFGMTAAASAATYTVNMCGASAQAGFWEASGAAVVVDEYNCDSGVLDWETGNDKNLIIRGLNCTVDSTGTKDDTVYVRYLASNSATGCNNYTCGSQNYALPSSCSFNPASPGSCTQTEADECQLGCADVPCPAFNASTRGAGSNCSTGGLVQVGPIAYTADTEIFQGVVVPFGFIVNDAVTHSVCDYTAVYDDIAVRPNPGDVEWAYNKDGWQCDPDKADACRGDYKCIDGFCQDGIGTRTCVTAADCKETICPTCVRKPLDNLSLLQVCHIFSGAVDNWRDFGPAFSEVPVTRCMRMAGSGTHQTMINAVMDLCGLSILTRTAPPYTCHYTSSTDLTRCVDNASGGIGYADADKAMFTSGLNNGVHQLKLNGSAPSRYDIASGKYLFFSSQVCFMDPTIAACHTGADALDAAILREIQTRAANPTYLAFSNFEQRAYFWATQDEMLVERLNGDPRNFPTNVPALNRPGASDDRSDW